MRTISLYGLAIFASLGLGQQASACSTIDISGTWDVVANGHVFEMDVTPAGATDFSGFLRSTSGEPRTRVHFGRCRDESRTISFKRQAVASGHPDQVYDGRFWNMNGIVGAAGHFHSEGDTSGAKFGFFMIKHAPVMTQPSPVNCVVPTLFYDANFSGDTRTYGAGTAISDLTGDGDEFSSVCVPSGFVLRAWEHQDFQGARITIVGPDAVPNLDNSSSTVNGIQVNNWGDEIHSLKVQ